jgi:hypothetical protein
MTILDSMMPDWDARRVERIVVDAPASQVLAAARTADFLDAVRQSLFVQVLFAMREAFERTVSAIRRQPYSSPPEPASLRLTDLQATGEWIRLGETSSEFAFGVVGRFWGGETRWASTSAAEFARYSEPGYARIGCHLHVTPIEGGRTLLSYEARTHATDTGSRRAFLRYWRVVSVFVGIVMRSTLRVVRDSVHETHATAATP